MNLKVKIGDRYIGKYYPIFIIAEAGVNHNGEIKIAKQLVDAAVIAGADAIKFQTFKSKNLVTPAAELAKYQKENLVKETSQLELLKKLELSNNQFIELRKYCDKKGIVFLSTPHTYEAIDFLENLVPAYKFGSGDINNLPTLQYAARKNKPMILGTGMATFEEVKVAVQKIKKENNNQIILLHCTTSYPCCFKEVNLNAMKTMEKELNCLVGYSDHTMGTTVPIMAATFGAVIIEKHFTLDKNQHGPDHKASLEPEEFKHMVNEIRNVEKALGNFEKKPTISESKIVKNVRKSIVANKDINRGSILTRDMLSFKRPALGISPAEIDNILGKKLTKDIKENEFIKYEMVE